MTYRILVTGGAGYLGSVLVPYLLRQGMMVTVLDNFMYRQMPLNAWCLEPRFDVVRGDVRDTALMRGLLSQADIFIPLAAIVGAPECDADPETAVMVNTDAVRTAIGMLSRSQRILIPITNSGYGIGEPGVPCTEESPLNPISLYGRTKVAAELAAFGHGNTIRFRLAPVFGMSPRMRLDLLVNDFVHRAFTDRALTLFQADFKRNYVHIADVARVFAFGIRHFENMRGRIFNVGLDDANLSKRELCAKIKEHVPGFVYLEAPIGEDPDKRDYIVSNARLAGLGFAPRYSLDTGIRELLKGYRMMRSGVHGNG